MIKELKYLLYIFTIISFILFVVNYYFSDQNKKNFYRSTKIYDSKIIKKSKNLKILKSDTDNILVYVENILNNKKKKYNFWELLSNNEK